MDKLIEFLTTKIGYTIAVVLGFLIPGNMFIFIWRRDLYLEMDIIKLLLLSFGIPFLIYIPNFIVGILYMNLREKIFGKDSDAPMFLLLLPMGLTVSVMSVAMVVKIINTNFTIEDFVIFYGVVVILAGIIYGVLNVIPKRVFQKIKSGIAFLRNRIKK